MHSAGASRSSARRGVDGRHHPPRADDRHLGQHIPIRAEIARIDSLSAHADADELTAWLATCPERPRRTHIVHGEPAAADALRVRLRDQLGWTTLVPTYGERSGVGLRPAAVFRSVG